MLLLAAGLWSGVRDRRRLPAWLDAQGYHPRAIEARYFTSGPFEDISLPGTKHGDRLYRVTAQDERGTEQVVWVRMPTSWPWTPRQWELRRDEAPERTWRGLGAPAFYTVALGLAAAVVSAIVFVVRSARS